MIASLIGIIVIGYSCAAVTGLCMIRNCARAGKSERRVSSALRGWVIAQPGVCYA